MSKTQKQSAKILADFKKRLAKQQTTAKKELSIDELTEDIILKTKQITTLKKIGAKFDLKNLNKFKSTPADIKTLQGLIIGELRKILRPEEVKVPKAVPKEDTEEEEGDNDTQETKEYKSIERYLATYIGGKTAKLLGVLGDKFHEIWLGLSRNDKLGFIRDYFELNTGDNKLNPLSYLDNWISEKARQDESPNTIVMKYLRALNRGTNTEVFLKSPAFPAQFLEIYESLDASDKLRFASSYISDNTLNPVDAIRIFKKTKQIGVVRHDPMKDIYSPDGRIKYTEEIKASIGKNNYSKCINIWKRFNLAVKPLVLEEEYYGELIKDGFYYPKDSLFMLMCKYPISLKEEVITIAGDTHRFIIKKVEASGELRTFREMEIRQMILEAESNNIFVKLDPIWILNTPLHQVPIEYLNAPDRYLSSWLSGVPRQLTPIQYDELGNIKVDKDGGITGRSGVKLFEDPIAVNFYREIHALQVNNRNESLLTYYINFLLTFASFIPDLQKLGLNINDKIRNNYLSLKAYTDMSLSEKIPEIPTESIISAIQAIAMKAGYVFVKTAITYGRLRPFPNLELEAKSISEICPELKGYEIRDVIIDNKGKCHSIDNLLHLFLVDKNEEGFDKSFVNDFLIKYGHLKENSFTLRDGTMIPPIVKVVKVAREKPEFKKFTHSELSQEFDKYFNLKEYIPNPLNEIEILMSFKEVKACQACGQVPKENVVSLQERSDGEIVQISFCDYKCMSKYKFEQAIHTAEEDIDYPMDMRTVAEKV